MWFFVSDLHLGHSNIIKYSNRPFLTFEEMTMLRFAQRGTIPIKEVKISQESTDRMTDEIIDNINISVRSDDHLVIVGDFCWSTKENRYTTSKAYRDRINCKNVYLIWGNHDDRDILKSIFTACYDQYIFNVDGQKIFVNHYPLRSWDKAADGCWMIYGHVHGKLSNEDQGKLPPFHELIYQNGFDKILSEFNIDYKDEIIKQLLQVCESAYGSNYTLDVGIDNPIRDGKVLFGTPWSVPEIKIHMLEKKEKWKLKQAFYESIKLNNTWKNY